ncbi:MAG: hypothetical protein HGA85_08050 [Nanoarchaeota archaeon]|nr:hypothetical protein [Nanoarchaeota archaeon]
MGYIKKSTTLVLFLMLLVSIIAFTGSVIFFQKTMSTLNEAISGKDSQIGSQKSMIEGLEMNLSRISDKLELQLRREENLSGQYSELKDANELLTSEKQSLTAKLNSTEAELKDREEEIEDLEVDISEWMSDYFWLNQTLRNVTNDAEYICDKAAALNLSRCKNYK